MHHFKYTHRQLGKKLQNDNKRIIKTRNWLHKGWKDCSVSVYWLQKTRAIQSTQYKKCSWTKTLFFLSRSKTELNKFCINQIKEGTMNCETTATELKNKIILKCYKDLLDEPQTEEGKNDSSMWWIIANVGFKHYFNNYCLAMD